MSVLPSIKQNQIAALQVTFIYLSLHSLWRYKISPLDLFSDSRIIYIKFKTFVNLINLVDSDDMNNTSMENTSI